MQAFEPNSFIPAMLLAPSDVYLSVSGLLAFTLTEGHKVSRKQNLLDLVCYILPSSLGYNLMGF